MKLAAIVGMACALVACSSAADVSQGIGLAQDSATEQSALPLNASRAKRVDAFELEDNQTDGEASRDFRYSWPSEVASITPLASILHERMYTELAAQKGEWEQAVAEFGNGKEEVSCLTCINRSYSMTWSVSAKTPRFLQLMGERFTYTGGAHGNTFFSTLMWDRKAKRGEGAAILPIDLFIDLVALESTAYGEYCAALNRVRSQRRGLDPEPTNPFDDCPSVADLVVSLGSSDGVRFDGIVFHAAPYVAGSFAEGPYEFAIPVSPAIIDAVKSEYRDSFAVGAG